MSLVSRCDASGFHDNYEQLAHKRISSLVFVYFSQPVFILCGIMRIRNIRDNMASCDNVCRIGITHKTYQPMRHNDNNDHFCACSSEMNNKEI